MFCTNYTNKVPQIHYLENRGWIVDTVATNNSFDPCPWQPMTHACKVLPGSIDCCLCCVSSRGSYINVVDLTELACGSHAKGFAFYPLECYASSCVMWWSLPRLGFWSMRKLGNMPDIAESEHKWQHLFVISMQNHNAVPHQGSPFLWYITIGNTYWTFTRHQVLC